MTTYEHYLRESAVSRKTIDVFLDENEPTWAKYDGEVGYTLGRYMPRDGIDGSSTISTSQDNGQRSSRLYAEQRCRINTYGNSFTQCHQVSDGETWQEYLAAHLGEPIRNFGMGGFGVYQAYRRMRRVETSPLGAKYAILYIWGDDHCRSVMRCRHAATHRWWNDENGRMFHGNFWSNVEMDLVSGSFTERDSLLPTPESLYKMCDAEFMVEALSDDLMVMLYAMERSDVEGDVAALKALAECLGVEGIDESDPDARRASVSALMRAYGFAASRYVVNEVGAFLREYDKQLMISLLCPTATDQVLRGHKRYDREFVDYLRAAGYLVFDMNEVHREDFKAFNLSVDEYRKRYWIGHYSPAGNHFFACSIKGMIADWLDPKPVTYRSDERIQDFEGYLPDVATGGGEPGVGVPAPHRCG
ncbi:MAG: hypothetical protein CME15_02340 [Gemmatimonadetes bacterium]|nr:hypothetical protein [Gemmatimonadota bacterium]